MKHPGVLVQPPERPQQADEQRRLSERNNPQRRRLGQQVGSDPEEQQPFVIEDAPFIDDRQQAQAGPGLLKTSKLRQRVLLRCGFVF
jgi:hypothetical protein